MGDAIEIPPSERRVRDMSVGEKGFAYSSGTFLDEARNVRIDSAYPVKSRSSCHACVPIERIGSEKTDFRVDISFIGYELLPRSVEEIKRIHISDDPKDIICLTKPELTDKCDGSSAVSLTHHGITNTRLRPVIIQDLTPEIADYLLTPGNVKYFYAAWIRR